MVSSLAQRRFDEALGLVGSDPAEIPIEPGSDVLVTSIRIVALESLGRTAEADTEMRRLLDNRSHSFLDKMWASSRLWQGCQMVKTRVEEEIAFDSEEAVKKRTKNRLSCIVFPIVGLLLVGGGIVVFLSFTGHLFGMGFNVGAPKTEEEPEREPDEEELKQQNYEKLRSEGDLMATLVLNYKPKPDRLVLPGDPCKTVGVSIINREQAEAEGFANVSLKTRCHGNTTKTICHHVKTHTWVKEGNTWKRLRAPKGGRYARKNYKNGDYAAAKKGAEEWLAVNPNSVQAYRILLDAAYAMDMGPDELEALEQKTMRAVMAINPEDSNALMLIAQVAGDPADAKRHLEHMAPDVLYRTEDYEAAKEWSDHALQIDPLYDPAKKLDKKIDKKISISAG